MSLPNNTTSLTALLSAVNALPDKIDTSGTAVAADIYAGKTATVNDVKLTGSNPYNAANVEPAVANALAELAEKGVDTSGKGLEDIAGLIANIEAGGGDGGVYDFGGSASCVVTGSFTVAEDTKCSDYPISVTFPDMESRPYVRRWYFFLYPAVRGNKIYSSPSVGGYGPEWIAVNGRTHPSYGHYAVGLGARESSNTGHISAVFKVDTPDEGYEETVQVISTTDTWFTFYAGIPYEWVAWTIKREGE